MTRFGTISFVLFALSSCLAQSGSGAMTILGDGADLLAAISAAAHGDTIEIHSNDTFTGSITWEDKFVTIQAGNGFQPTIGPIANVRGNSLTGGLFRGLHINGGVFNGGGGTRFSHLEFRDNHIDGVVSHEGTAMNSGRYEFYDNTISGIVGFGGTGDVSIEAVLRNNEIGAVSISGTGRRNLTAEFDGNRIHESFVASQTGDATYNISIRNNSIGGELVTSGIGSLQIAAVHDNDIAGGFSASSFGVSRINVSLRRNRIGDTMLFGVGEFSTHNYTAVNNVVNSNGDSLHDIGIRVHAPGTGTGSTTNANFVNNTVVGFDQGVVVDGLNRESVRMFNVHFENMLLHAMLGVSGLLSDEIHNSLISDGTFAGQNGNFAGVPLLGPLQQLLAGSPGIDAGNNAVAELLLTDIIGNPRILDGNGDGIARVDVGAFEFVIPEPATHLLLLTHGIVLLGGLPRRRCRS